MSVPWHFWIHLLSLQNFVLGHLDCAYNSLDLVSCSWKAARDLTSVPCYVFANVTNDRRCIKGSCSLPPNAHSRSCAVKLTTDGKFFKQSLTGSHNLNISVICSSAENRNKSVTSMSFYPFKNLRLDPPRSLDIKMTTNSIWNLSWDVSLSYYIENTETEVLYKPVKRSWQDAKHFMIIQSELSVPLRDLHPGTQYEAKVRVNQTDFSGGRWSDWSKPVQWTTPSADTPGPNILIQVVAPLAAIVIFVLLVSVVIHSSKRIKKIMWISVPDPSSFFDPLMSTHKGDFQKWLSSPFSFSSFSLYPSHLDISSLDINGKKEEHYQNINPILTQEGPRERSGQSCSSFSNQGYFSSMCLSYDHMDHRGFPTMVSNGPLSSPTAEDMPLFHADYLCAPLSVPGLGVHNRSFELDAPFRAMQVPILVEEVINKTEYHDERLETSVPPEKKKVSEEEEKEKCEDPKQPASASSTSPFTQQHVDTQLQDVNDATGYLSLNELNQKHYGHWV
ncbi:interleukin-2 receptor subunit beta [Mixophyes fleayi]|uniref:interleukin-2 receptor subunit beta n=1 Tax=Mixophyes fleayi TaxID=3061075 RepID=UPI003F4D8727